MNTDRDRLDRARRVYELVLSGTSWPAIADHLGCSVTHAHQLYRQYRSHRDETATAGQLDLF